MKNILIIGAGAMGSAFSVPCVENNNNVSLIGTHLEDSLIETIKSKNNFHPKLNVSLPSKLKVEKIEKLDDLMKEIPDVLVVGVSSIGIDWFVDKIADKIDNKTSLVILTKGLSIVNKKLSTISDKIKIMLSEKGIEFTNISAIKGPCLAAGLANRIRTSTLIASPNIAEAKKLQKIISTDYYSTEISEDLNGVELSGAIKNIYSMIIGSGQGNNTASALFMKSIDEMEYLINFFKGKKRTVFGLAGIGDLYVSAVGGRNSRMGEYLGKGFTFKNAKKKFMRGDTVEGADLALEIAPFIYKKINKQKIPLMIALLNAITKDKKLKINY